MYGSMYHTYVTGMYHMCVCIILVLCGHVYVGMKAGSYTSWVGRVASQILTFSFKLNKVTFGIASNHTVNGNARICRTRDKKKV